jgi:hypothetical protein
MNPTCCGDPLVTVEIPELYDGGAYYQCAQCETCFHRWARGSDMRVRIEQLARREGVTLRELPPKEAA